MVKKVLTVEPVRSIKSSTFCVHKDQIKIDFNGVETINKIYDAKHSLIKKKSLGVSKHMYTF